MSYFFTSESVSEGHPDKVADQISDALLDEFLRRDAHSHVACETLVTTGLAVISGEITCNGYVEIQDTVREVIRRIDIPKENISLRPTPARCSRQFTARAETSTKALTERLPKTRGQETKG